MTKNGNRKKTEDHALRDYDWAALDGMCARRIEELRPDEAGNPTAEELARLRALVAGRTFKEKHPKPRWKTPTEVLEQVAYNDQKRRFLRDWDWVELPTDCAECLRELLPKDPAHPTVEERQRLGGVALLGPLSPDTLNGDLKKLAEVWEAGGCSSVAGARSAFESWLSDWNAEADSLRIEGRYR